MPRYCAFGCPYKPGVSTHNFPHPDKFPERFKTWIKLTGVKLEDIGDPKSYYRRKCVCDIHFQDKDRNRYNRLNALTVPSLHLPAFQSPFLKGDESYEEDNDFETEIREQNVLIEKLIKETNTDGTENREQNEIIEKFMEETKKDESEVREKIIEENNQAGKVKESAGVKKYGSKVYLTKLMPVVKKCAIIAPGKPSERQQYAKYLPKKTERLSENYAKILQHDNAAYTKRINELLVNQDKLERRVKDLETKIKRDEDDFITKVKEKFSNVFTSNQIDMIMDKKKLARWNEIEYTKAYTLYDLNKRAYFYVLDTLNYPFPDFTSLQKWAAKFGDEMLDSDDDEVKQPLLKRLKLTLDKTTKQYHNKNKDNTDCAIQENELPSDTETIDENFISNIQKTGNDHSNIEKDIEKTKQSDRQDNIEAIKATESSSLTNVSNNNDNEVYEEVDYLDHDVEDENDDYIHNNVLDNVSETNSDDDNNLNNDLDDCEQMTEIWEQTDEYYYEVIIDNLDEHEVIENLNRDNTSVIEEDNG